MALAERVEALPTGPGVYLFKSRSGRVLYIGKAQNLRSRVRSYVSGGDGRIRVPQLVERTADVDVVDEDHEALLGQLKLSFDFCGAACTHEVEEFSAAVAAAGRKRCDHEQHRSGRI